MNNADKHIARRNASERSQIATAINAWLNPGRGYGPLDARLVISLSCTTDEEIVATATGNGGFRAVCRTLGLDITLSQNDLEMFDASIGEQLASEIIAAVYP